MVDLKVTTMTGSETTLYLDQEGDERVKAAYAGPTYDRLVHFSLNNSMV